jgi:hypothetical protein
MSDPRTIVAKIPLVEFSREGDSAQNVHRDLVKLLSVDVFTQYQCSHSLDYASLQILEVRAALSTEMFLATIVRGSNKLVYLVNTPYALIDVDRDLVEVTAIISHNESEGFSLARMCN